MFARVLFSRNFVYAKFRENKPLAKISEFTLWLTDIDSSCFSVANMSFSALCENFRIYSTKFGFFFTVMLHR